MDLATAGLAPFISINPPPLSTTAVLKNRNNKNPLGAWWVSAFQAVGRWALGAGQSDWQLAISNHTSHPATPRLR
jgi:hypothetical protein